MRSSSARLLPVERPEEVKLLIDYRAVEELGDFGLSGLQSLMAWVKTVGSRRY
jgi:hypothetical protein